MYLNYCAACTNLSQKQKSIGIVNLQCRSNSRYSLRCLVAPGLHRIAGLLFLLLFILALGVVGNWDYESAQEIENHLSEIRTQQNGGAQ